MRSMLATTPAATVIRLFDGEAQPITASWALVTVHASGVSIFRRWVKPPVAIPIRPTAGVSAIAHIPGYRDGAYGPFDRTPESVFLMLRHKKGRLRFPREPKPGWAALLTKEEYDATRENRPVELATVLNVLSACEPLGLTPEIRRIEWATLQPDRFWAWVSPNLIRAVERFEPSPAALHPGATRTFKQNEFDVANVQFSLHENDVPPAGLEGSTRVEFDMDYHRDRFAHLLLEVLPNRLSGGRTDPETIYALRWMAGRNRGEDSFAPFTIA